MSIASRSPLSLSALIVLLALPTTPAPAQTVRSDSLAVTRLVLSSNREGKTVVGQQLTRQMQVLRNGVPGGSLSEAGQRAIASASPFHSAAKGAGIGAGVGGVGFAAVTYLANQGTSGEDYWPLALIVGGLVGGVAGFAAGGLVGLIW